MVKAFNGTGNPPAEVANAACIPEDPVSSSSSEDWRGMDGGVESDK
ncbi:hypothetical protein [Paenibacillus contaminans]|nr:hypothetical protein [Paenibacillus contaminans]